MTDALKLNDLPPSKSWRPDLEAGAGHRSPGRRSRPRNYLPDTGHWPNRSDGVAPCLFGRRVRILQRLPLTFELASLATTLGVRHGLVILDAQQYHSGGCLVGGTSVKGGMLFERVLICYGPVGNISASSGLLILLDMAR